MIPMRTCYTIVSDLALCQRCPALFAYKLHCKEKDAWKVGIKGGGFPYGTIFHENIARVFFEAAAHSRNRLHAKIVQAVSGGISGLEAVVRKNIFIPFVSRYAGRFSSGQLMAMAKGVNVWVRAMAEFFRSIPSLVSNPEGNMDTVFIEPEQKLQAGYDLDGGRLVITGCYDALMFNPDKAEARLFEFKGYRKSDITVPLSQSLIYSWLIERRTGIVPSVEIIYLDEEDKVPDVFDSQSVRGMIGAGLPDLFRSAFDIISLRRRPEILRDNNLCSVCKFNGTCRKDYDNVFRRRRRGSSMVSVMVFFMAAVVITAQVYFFTTLSLEDGIEEREIMTRRIKLEQLIASADMELRKTDLTNDTDTIKYANNFYDATSMSNKLSHDIGEYHVKVHNLYYSIDNIASTNDRHKSVFSAIPPDSHYTSYDLCSDDRSEYFTEASMDKVFETIKEHSRDVFYSRKYYLIRAYTETSSGRKIMHQSLVRSEDIKVFSFTSKDPPLNYLDETNGVNQDFRDNMGSTKISFDNTSSADFDTLTYMEVWY